MRAIWRPGECRDDPWEVPTPVKPMETAREWLDRLACDMTAGYSRQHDLDEARKVDEWTVYQREGHEFVIAEDRVTILYWGADIDAAWDEDDWRCGSRLFRYPDERWIT